MQNPNKTDSNIIVSELANTLPEPQGDDMQVMFWTGIRTKDGFLVGKLVYAVLADGAAPDNAGSTREGLMATFDTIAAKPFRGYAQRISERDITSRPFPKKVEAQVLGLEQPLEAVEDPQMKFQI